MLPVIRRLRRRLGSIRRNLAQLGQLTATEARVSDLEAATGQLRSLVRELGALPVPPRHLQVRVVGVYAPDFLDSGWAVIADIERVLTPVGRDLRSFGTMLDFGCGCGRVLRALRAHAGSEARLHGTDIDQEAIGWCQRHWSSIARFETNDALPPTRYADDSFDLVYSISIFTHLPEDMQFAWLEELQRIVKPGGLLVLTYHGKNHYQHIPKKSLDEFSRRGFLYVDTGGTEGLPGFYQTSFHTEGYIRATWSRYFDIVDIVPVAVGSSQDAVVCRSRRPQG